MCKLTVTVIVLDLDEKKTLVCFARTAWRVSSKSFLVCFIKTCKIIYDVLKLKKKNKCIALEKTHIL